MIIDIDEIKQVLYLHNAKYYDFYFDTDENHFVIDFDNEYFDKCDVDGIIKALKNMGLDVEYDYCIYILTDW